MDALRDAMEQTKSKSGSSAMELYSMQEMAKTKLTPAAVFGGTEWSEITQRQVRLKQNCGLL